MIKKNTNILLHFYGAAIEINNPLEISKKGKKKVFNNKKFEFNFKNITKL